MDVLNDFREVLTKKPFLQITSQRTLQPLQVVNKNDAVELEGTDRASYTILSQEEMLRQYYPTGHKINNDLLYPDIWKQDPETKRWYQQKITRCALGFQQVITTKHLIHLIGNDVQFELSDKDGNKTEDVSVPDKADTDPNALFKTEDDENTSLLNTFRKGWMHYSMEMRFYEAVRSLLTTSEGAIVGYIGKNGEAGFRSLSFLNGDKLYPHYDTLTGELTLFARRYYDYDEDGTAVTEWVEVWDEKKLYRFKRGTPDKSIIFRIKDLFGMNGYEMVSDRPHGFSFVPVAYVRNDDGPCWSAAEDTIEKFEEALSYFFENNKAYAFPILVVTGEGVELQGDANGAVKAISIDSSDGDAHFLDHNDVSASYNTLLTKFYDLIYEQSFTVKPPELKSGDLPGVALKLLYSPAIERAIEDSQMLQPFLDTLVHMVKYMWGLHEDCQSDLLNLAINAWIEPYVHQNDTELVTNLSQAVQNNILSVRTASERLTKYAKNDEYDRVVRQMKEKMLLNVEEANLKQSHVTEEKIREEKEKAKLNNSGQDINTGGGAGANRVRETDENGNRPNENNWEKFNQTRF